MKKQGTSKFFLVAAMFALLIDCTRQSSTAPVYTYQWASALSDNFTVAAGSWQEMYGVVDFSGNAGLPWSWGDTSGGALTFRDGQALAAGRVHGAAFIKGATLSNPVRISLHVLLSSADSNSAAVVLIDSAIPRQYLLSIGRNSGDQPAPRVFTIACLSADGARRVISEAHQTVPGLAANVLYQLELTLDGSSIQGSLLQAGSSIGHVAVDPGISASSQLYAGIDLEGMPSLPVNASGFTVAFYYPSRRTCTWQWSDASAIRLDSLASTTPATVIGHTAGIPTQKATGVRYSWIANSPLRVSMDIRLSSTAFGAAAVTILDNASDRRYWLIIGNNGVGQAAAGELSVIMTQADSPQTIVDQTHQTVRNLSANTDYRLVLTLDNSTISGEIQQSGSSIAQTKISASPISAGKTEALFPGVDFVGTASSPVYADNFQVETYQQQVSTGSGGSCPFIYSFDGAHYVIDAEPYGGSICKGLKRTEWCVLHHCKEVGGAYELLMTNELDETQYTDELKLLAVDHPCSLFVGPDVSGKIHTFSRPLIPLSAEDRSGENILALCAAQDGQRWTGSMKRFDPDGKDEPRDTLTFRFAKPRNAASAKLLINAGTTDWGEAMGKRFLAMYGSGVDRWYDEVDKGGAAYERIMKWYRDEGLYMLKLQVHTREGWKTRATILGAGPVVAADRVYVIDIHDAPGDTLSVRLAPPAGFWTIDWVAADYTADAPITVHEIPSLHALNRTGGDVRMMLDSIDNNWHVAEKGDSVRMVFPAPPPAKGLGRTVVLKANGYYKIHLKASGLPEFGLLAHLDKPGFSARFALREYRKLERAQAR
jgi:hypothetical protein